MGEMDRKRIIGNMLGLLKDIAVYMDIQDLKDKGLSEEEIFQSWVMDQNTDPETIEPRY